MVADAGVQGNAGGVITAIPAPKVHGSFAGGIGRITGGRLVSDPGSVIVSAPGMATARTGISLDVGRVSPRCGLRRADTVL
jgi:hypothetical protein